MTGPILARIAAGALASFTLVSAGAAGAAGANAAGHTSRAAAEHPAVVTAVKAPCDAGAVAGVRAGASMMSVGMPDRCDGR